MSEANETTLRLSDGRVFVGTLLKSKEKEKEEAPPPPRLRNRVMLFLKTMGTLPGCVICSIGAVRFDEVEIVSEFYRAISVLSYPRKGFHISGPMVLKWMKESEEARQEVLWATADIHTVVDEFADWLNAPCAVQELWGRASDYDAPILAGAYRTLQMKVPWDFRVGRCFRTLKEMAPEVNLERTEAPHNALDSARMQAAHVLRIQNA